MRNTLYSHTWLLSPLPGRKRSHQCTGRCISCVCCGGGCSRCPVLPLPPGSCPDTLGGRPSPRFGTPRSLAVSGRNLGPVPLCRPPLCAWEGDRAVTTDPQEAVCNQPLLNDFSIKGSKCLVTSHNKIKYNSRRNTADVEKGALWWF